MALEGKVVLITGASAGIGAETAVQFARLGASLSLTGRNEQNLEAVAKRCDQTKTFIIVGDVGNEDDVKNILESTINHYGKLDILVNNAGTLEVDNMENSNLQRYDNIFNVNVRAVYQLTALAVPHLIKTKGNIVNVSSLAGKRAFSGALSYCMSKAALDQFTRCVAVELAPKQVRVNAVNPGIIVTNILANLGFDGIELKEYLERCKTTYPLGRVGDVSEVAKAIVFLAKDDASFITGVTLPIDGGIRVTCPN